MADFGLWGQVYECSTDPTIGAVLADGFDNVQSWIERMHYPRNEGAFETWDSLQPTLAPLLHDEVGGLFLPWTMANAAALEAGEESFTVELEGRAFTQQTQKYHARSLGAIRAKYAAAAGTGQLDAILEEAGCLEFLSA